MAMSNSLIESAVRRRWRHCMTLNLTLGVSLPLTSTLVVSALGWGRVDRQTLPQSRYARLDVVNVGDVGDCTAFSGGAVQGRCYGHITKVGEELASRSDSLNFRI